MVNHMELVVNDEPVTIKITIEVIPAKKKDDIKEETVVKPPNVIPKLPNVTTVDIDTKRVPEGWDAIEPENPLVEPVATPEKKKRAYTRKAKTTEEPPVEEKKPESIIDEKPAEAVPTKVETKPASTSNKVVARLAQMIRFYCKASGIETSTITIAHLKEKAFDIVENVADDVITEAIKEASKK